jgi:hypothetical protein
MNKVLVAAGALAALAATGCVPARMAVPATAGAAPVATPVCDSSYGYDVGGTLTVTVLHTASVPCDLVGGQSLNLVWNGETEGAEWGGDSSVAAAAAECDDSGGTQHWYNDGDYRLVCEDVDF